MSASVLPASVRKFGWAIVVSKAESGVFGVTGSGLVPPGL